MDKKQALKVLIQHSFLLKEDEKSKLLAHVDSMNDEEVENLGKFFATEKRESLKFDKTIINNSEEILKSFDDKIKDSP